MKRMLSLVLSVILILGLSGCEKKEKNPFDVNGDFRNVSWGMTIDEVKKLETAELTEESSNSLIYRDQVGKYADVEVMYSFKGDKLIKGDYFFSEDYTDASLHIEDFDQIKGDLNTIYGKAKKDELNWVNEPDYTLTQDQLGALVAKNELSYFAYWETDTEEIMFGMSGMNGKIGKGLFFSSKEFAYLAEAYEADTTGYQPARDYQLYEDNPDGYEGEFIYIKGKITNTSFEEALIFQDENYHPWLAVTTYPISNGEILQDGDEVTLFGQVKRWPAMDHAVSLMLFKVDKDGEVLHVVGPGGSTFEEIFFSLNKQ